MNIIKQYHDKCGKDDSISRRRLGMCRIKGILHNVGKGHALMKSFQEDFPCESVFNYYCQKIFKYFGIKPGSYCIRHKDFNGNADLFIEENLIRLRLPYKHGSYYDCKLLKSEDGEWLLNCYINNCSRENVSGGFLRKNYSWDGKINIQNLKSLLKTFLSYPRDTYEIMNQDY